MLNRPTLFITLLAWGVVLLGTRICWAASQDDDLTFQSTLDFGFGFVDEDGFILLLPEQGLSWKGLDIRLQGPLRFKVIDRDPDDTGIVRNQDWDDGSDYARILRSLEYVHEWEDADVDLYFGELNHVGIGHGSLADGFFNSTDMDYYQGGLLLKGQWAGNGGEFMMENVVVPEILLGRVFIAPLSWFLKGKWPRRLEIGYTLGADIAAPYRTYNQGETTILFTGGDASFRVVDEDWLVLMPYIDIMTLDGGLGVHAGLATSWVFSQSRGLSLHLRGEYRYADSDYHPTVFNPFYEYNRLFYEIATTSETPTFADSLGIYDPPKRHGLMVETIFEWEDGLRLSARYDREGKDSPHWVMFRLELFPWDGYTLSALYAGQDIQGDTGLFSFDSLMGISMRGRIWKPLYVFLELTRRWRRQGNTMGFANEIGGGVGVSIVY